MSNGIGIDVSVNARNLSAAKREILDTSKALNEIEKHSDLNIDAKSNIPTIVQDIMSSMRKLESIEGKGTKAGGLKAGDSNYAAQLLDRFKRDAAAYEQAMGRMGRQLDELYEKKRKLEAVPFTSPQYERAQKELESINRDYQARLGEYEKTQNRYDSRVDLAANRVARTGGSIEGMQAIPEGGGGGGWGKFGIGKAFGYGAALMGGFSIMSFLHDSMQKAGSYHSGEADFQMRTGEGLAPWALSHGSRYGFAPGDTLRVYDTLNRSTGMKGSGLAMLGQQAIEGSRAWGTTPEAILGYQGAMGAVMNGSPVELKKQTERLQRIAEGIGQGGRIEEILRRNQDITVSAAQAIGRGLTSTEISGITDLQMRLWGGSNLTGALGTSAINNLQNAAATGGGSQRGKMFMYHAFGGGDIRNVTDYLDVMERMQGPMTTDKANRIFSAMQQIPGAYGKDGRLTDYGALFLTNLGLPVGQSRELIMAANSGAFSKDLTMGNGMTADLARWEKTDGAHHLKTMAGVEGLKVIIGGGMLPWIDDLKDKGVGLYDSIKKGDLMGGVLNFLKDNPLGDAMLVAGGLKAAGSIAPAATGFGAGAATGAGGARFLPWLLNPTTAAVAAGAYTMYGDIDSNEDEMAKRMKTETLPELRRDAKQLAAETRTPDWSERLLGVLNELSIFLHNLNNDPIRRPPGAVPSTH